LSRVAFLFPGQGAQYVGMGKKLAQSLPAARKLFEDANDVLGYDLASLCFDGPAEKLNKTGVGQPALFVTSLAALASLQETAPETIDSCDVTAGLSLGEYTAMVFAGVMDFETGLRVVKRRGEAMQEAADQTPSGMASVLGMDEDQLEDLCDAARGDDVLEIANYLCPGNRVVSGHFDAIGRLRPMAIEAGAMQFVDLPVTGAFHTSLMQSAVVQLEAELQDAKLLPARVPVVSNVDARAHKDPLTMRNILIRQVVQPVLWEETMMRMMNENVTKFYEIGPGRVLRGLLKRIHRKVSCENVIG